MAREPHYHHTHFLAAVPLVEMLPAEHVQAQVEWMTDQAKRAGLTLEQANVVADRVVRRRPFGLIRQGRGLKPGQAEALFRDGLRMLEGVDGFWDAAREFPRSLVQAVTNKADHRDVVVCDLGPVPPSSRRESAHIQEMAAQIRAIPERKGGGKAEGEVAPKNYAVRTQMPKADVFRADRQELRQCAESAARLWVQAGS